LTFTVSLVFFRASSVESAWNFVAGLVGMHGFGLPLDPAADLGRIGAMLAGLGMKPDAGAAAYMKLPGEFLWIFGLGAFVLLFPNSQQLLRPFRPVLEYDTAEDEDAPVRVLGIDLGALLTRAPRLAARFAGPLAGAALASAISGLIFWQSWNRIEIVQFIYFQF